MRLWHVAAVLAGFALIYVILAQQLGMMFALIALAALVVAIVEVFRNAVGMGLTNLDHALMKIPVIGPIYERYFRKETYHRQDTRLVYLKMVPDIVKNLAEEISGAKGIKLTDQYETAPVFGELYQRVPTKDKEP